MKKEMTSQGRIQRMFDPKEADRVPILDIIFDCCRAMGPKLLRTVELTAIWGAGQLAALTDGEAVSLFGKKGPVLRDLAQATTTCFTGSITVWC